MFCRNCGAQIPDHVQYCTACGAPVADDSVNAPQAAYTGAPVGAPGNASANAAHMANRPCPPYAQAQPQPQAQPQYASPIPPTAQPQPAVIAQENYGEIYPVTSADRTLRLIAFILCLLFTIGFAFSVIPLAWMIPMTVITWGIYQGKKRNTVAFGVCTLIFCSPVSGILLLCSHKDE